jgi:hypothetical protein
MAHDFIPPPTIAQLQAALSNLPDGYAGFGESLLASPDLTATVLLIVADALDAGAKERRTLFPGGDPEAAGMSGLASILRDATPHFPHPPRLPATPIDAMTADRRART